jgi:membrane protein implicated in regulation of membrane protease activity
VTVYLVLGVVGLLLVAVSLVAGDVLDGALDALEADWFSSAVIGGFVSAFGFGGAIADGAGLPLVVSLPVGLGAGLLVGWLAWWLTRLLKDGPSDGTVTAADSIGRLGTVVTAIPADGYGVVRIVVGGHTLRYNARSPLAIEAGTEVNVSDVLSPTAVAVTPVWTPDN